MSSPDEIVGKQNSELSSWGSNELNQINRMVMSSGKLMTKEEHFIVAKGVMDTITHKIPVYNKNKEVIGLIGISFDITARKQAEELLKAEKENAERANADKTNFILNMSHDIRTPITR